MSWLPLSFGFPAILWGLLALPVIWWLLRLTPPKPQMEVFPPLKILARVLRKEETPHQSPWWLTLLRLLMAALIVLALAEPIWNPRERLPTGGSALALVIDNGWASARDWDRRVATAERLIADANATGSPVVLAFTAEKPNADIGPFDAAAALDKLNVAEPRPVPVDRQAIYARVAAALDQLPGASVAVLADGLAAPGDDAAFSALLGRNPANVFWAVPDRLDMVGLTAAENEVAGFALSAIRAPGDPAPRQVTAGAFDDKGRRIADADHHLRPGPDGRHRPDDRALRTAQRLCLDRHRRRAAGSRRARARRELQAPPRRAALAVRGRPGAAAALAALLHHPRAAALRRSRRALEPGSRRSDPGAPRAEAGDDRHGRCRHHPRHRAHAADRLGQERRHAGALRRLAARRGRQ